MATRISRLTACAATGFVFCATSLAQDAGKIHNFSIAPEVSSYEYKEPGLMKYSGTMYGLTAEYLNNGGVGRIKESMPIQLRARLTYMRGNNLDYDGKSYTINPDGSMSIAPFKFGGDQHYYYDTIFAGGIEVKVTEKLSISPYQGLGYRYLVDKDVGTVGIFYDNKGTPIPMQDNKREQTYYYLPTGVDLKMPLGSGWKLAFNTELDILLRGENKSHHEDGVREYRQESGYGLRVSAKVEKDIQSVGVFAEPFFRHWDIAKSNKILAKEGGVQVRSWEPKNKTNEYGLRVGVTF